MSGQGPYFGQWSWFEFFHPEDVPSAKERYSNEVARVWGVLDRILEGEQYLVGNRFTYADIAFIPWNQIHLTVKDAVLATKHDAANKFPNFYAWHKRLMERDSVKATIIFPVAP
jgi:glutathione S-transferase